MNPGAKLLAGGTSQLMLVFLNWALYTVGSASIGKLQTGFNCCYDIIIPTSSVCYYRPGVFPVI